MRARIFVASTTVIATLIGGAAFMLAHAASAQHEGHDGHAGHDATATAPAELAPSVAAAATVAPPTTTPPPPPNGPVHTSTTATTGSDKREEPRTAIDVPAVQQTRIGLMTAKLEQKRVTPTLRTVAVVQVDERKEAHVHTRVPGFIDEIYVNAVGQQVKKGQTLYRIYSPDIVATQQEYLAARGQGEIGKKVSQAALDRLALWGVSPKDIAALKDAGAVKRSLAVESPATGVVVEKMAVQGIYATPEMHLYRIADLSNVWVVASLYETEIALVKNNDAVDIELPSAPGQVIHANVGYVYPELDVATRTGKARIELPNPDGALKPGMYATVSIKKDLGDVLVVPEDAVIDTGARRIVFVKTGDTRFTPTSIVVGPRVGDTFVVISGVSAGDDVVVRASFLIDAESRLQAALKSGGAPQGHAGHGDHSGNGG